MRAERLKLKVSDDGWSEDWPTEPDTIWWFYGWTSSFGMKNLPPSLSVVEVWMTGETLSYVSNGGFVYAQEGAFGKWKKAEVGSIPTLTKPE